MRLHAQTLHNAAQGEISSPGIITLSAGQTLRNEGRVNGGITWLSADRIDNTGLMDGTRTWLSATRIDNTGQISGADVALSAALLRNHPAATAVSGGRILPLPACPRPRRRDPRPPPP